MLFIAKLKRLGRNAIETRPINIALPAFAIWTVVAIIEGVQNHYVTEQSGHPIPFSLTVRMPLAYGWFWTAASPLIFWAVRRYPIQGRPAWRNFSVHASLWILLSGIHALYRIPLHAIIYPYLPNQGWVSLFSYYLIGNLIDNLLVYGIIACIAHALDIFEKYKLREIKTAQLQTQLAEANLQTLKNQIQPHFLFNTLHNISALMHEDVELAENMMTDLSDLLRQTLESGDAHEATVSEEIKALEPYLSIQRTRFQDRLTFELRIDPEALSALLPTMVIHTLVENSVRHGIAPRASAGKVTVQVAKTDNVLGIAVTDNGVGVNFPIQEAFAKGIGLKNTRERLRQLYGDNFSLDLENLRGSGFGVFVSIPFQIKLGSREPEEALA
ncbi:MAG: yehU 2 [Acidobacteriales bacterium]|nr:yehU 2 [Terriglobales bacterium]